MHKFCACFKHPILNKEFFDTTFLWTHRFFNQRFSKICFDQNFLDQYFLEHFFGPTINLNSVFIAQILFGQQIIFDMKIFLTLSFVNFDFLQIFLASNIVWDPIFFLVQKCK